MLSLWFRAMPSVSHTTVCDTPQVSSFILTTVSNLRIHILVPLPYQFGDETFTLLGCYGMWVGSLQQLFRDSLLVQSSMVKQSHWPLKVGPLGCPETLVTNYQTMFCQHPRLQLHCSGSLKTCHSKMVLKCINCEGKFVRLINNFTVVMHVERRWDSMNSWSWLQIEMSCQILTLLLESTAGLGWIGCWIDSESIWTWSQREKFLKCVSMFSVKHKSLFLLFTIWQLDLTSSVDHHQPIVQEHECIQNLISWGRWSSISLQ
jgi:hypothetical protein